MEEYIKSYVEPVPPVADLSGSPIKGKAPLLVQFKDLSSGEVDEWLWDFGDGGVSNIKNPSHIYRRAGTYTVSLMVKGPGGEDACYKEGYIEVERRFEKLEEALKDACWVALGIPRYPESAFFRKAKALDLGRPVTSELRIEWEGRIYAAQGFEKGILFTLEGDWDLERIKVLEWL